MKRIPLRLFAALAVVAVLGAACGSSDDSDPASSASSGTETTVSHRSASGSAGADSPASALRAGLTALLQEHVYLAGITTGTALGGGDMKPPAAALDKNSVALADAIGSVYGPAARDQFLALWRKHIGFFVDYTVAASKGDSAGKAAAVKNLDQYRADFDAFLTGANPNLPKGAVAEDLVGHVATLAAAVDAQAAKDPSQYAKLAEAASHMPATAAVLAGAIAKQFPDKFGS